MSIDTSLKFKGSLTSHRNVLTRVERLAKLAEAGKFDAKKNPVLGLPKVRSIKGKI